MNDAPRRDRSYGARVWICPECRSLYKVRVDKCERDDMPVAEVKAHQVKARYPLLNKVIDNRYQLIGGLGQGGLGTVYLARHLHLEQLFAVKFLDLESVGIDVDKDMKKEYQHDFMREAKVAALLRHDAVVKVIDFGEFECLPYLVMDYVPGPSLLGMITDRGRFTVPEAINIARRIADALGAFHERMLVHRDLKPANVIMDPRGDGQLTLVDLGLVKDVSGPAGRLSTHPMALRGTPGYLAPEQVPSWVLSGQGIDLGSVKKIVDARADVYALGVIFYEMIAGVSPYPDGSNTSIIVYACTKPPLPLTGVQPPIELMPGLEALIYRTMSRHPQERPQSAAEFIELLDKLTMAPTNRRSWPVVLPPGARATAPKPMLSRHGLAPPSAFRLPGNNQQDSYFKTMEGTDALDIMDDDPFATQLHHSEDATMEVNLDESFDGILDNRDLEITTHASSYDGSSDFMMTRVDTMDPRPAERLAQPSALPRRSTSGAAHRDSLVLKPKKNQRWLWMVLPLVAILAGAVVWFVRQPNQGQAELSSRQEWTTNKQQKAQGTPNRDHRRRIEPAVVVEQGTDNAKVIVPNEAGQDARPKEQVTELPATVTVTIPTKPPTMPAVPQETKKIPTQPVEQKPRVVKAKSATQESKGQRKASPRDKPTVTQRNGPTPKKAQAKGTPSRNRLNETALKRLLDRGNEALRAGRCDEALKKFKKWQRSASRSHGKWASVEGRIKHCEQK